MRRHPGVSSKAVASRSVSGRSVATYCGAEFADVVACKAPVDVVVTGRHQLYTTLLNCLLLKLVLMLSIYSVMGPVQARGGPSMVEQLYAVSGMEAQISQIPDAIQAGFDQSVANGDLAENFPAESVRKLRSGMAQAFSADRLGASIKKVLDAELSLDEMAAALAWHKSPLGQRIAEFESSRSNISQPEEHNRLKRESAEAPVDGERWQALESLELAWAVIDSSVDMMVGMQIAVSAALVSMLPREQQMPLESLVKMIEAQRPQLQQHFSTETLVSMAYVYEPLSLNEIERYRDFALSESGAAYVAAVNRALEQAMLEGSMMLGQLIGKVMSQQTAEMEI